MATNGSVAGDVQLRAIYASPDGSQKFEHQLPINSAAPTTKDKISYLSTLRESVSKLQEEVNSFLTAKMEGDKNSAIKSDTKVDEEEEENYGEEVVEDETVVV